MSNPENTLTVCLLNDSFPPLIDGVANAVVNYARILEEKYGHALVAAPAVPGADDSGFPFPVLRYPSIDTRKLVGYVAGYPFSPETAYRVREEGTQLLHLHCPLASALLARQLRESMDLPLVMTYHTKYDIDIANAIHSKALQEGAIAALLQNIKACDEVWTVSRGAGENLLSLGYQGTYQVMENGMDLPRGKVSPQVIAAATEGWDLPEGVPVFLFVWRLMWYKGLRIILDALAELKAKGRPFRMVFIGAGSDGDAVRDYAGELGLGGCCFFTGPIGERDALRAWYSRADLFLFPSTFDTNGLVVREAAACDLATVMIAGSCAAEGVTDGRNGFLIEENAPSLAARLEALCAAPDTMARVGERAGEELYLSWEEAVDRAVQRYRVVLDHYRAGVYRKQHSLQDEFLRSQGELMEVMGRLGAAGQEFFDTLRESSEEARQKRRELREEAREKRRETRERLEKAFLQHWDRYM